jgi:hypothetical protein
MKFSVMKMCQEYCPERQLHAISLNDVFFFCFLFFVSRLTHSERTHLTRGSGLYSMSAFSEYFKVLRHQKIGAT